MYIIFHFYNQIEENSIQEFAWLGFTLFGEKNILKQGKFFLNLWDYPVAKFSPIDEAN